MSDYSDYNPGDDDRVPMKLMGFVGGIAIAGVALLFVFLNLSRKDIDPNIDPTNPAAFEQTESDLEETPDLWVQKKPMRVDGPTQLGNPLAKLRAPKSPTIDSPVKKDATSQPS